VSETKKKSHFDAILTIEVWIASFLLIFIILSVCHDVFMRYFMNRPQKYVIETSEYALLFITFLVTAWILKEDRHVVVDVILMRLSEKRRSFLNVFSSSVIILVSLILIIFGFQVFVDDCLKGVYNATPLEFYRAPIILIIPVGSIFLFIQGIKRLIKSHHAYRGSNF
jgi:C4-dicarboxylate transporter DctQ subunit